MNRTLLVLILIGVVGCDTSDKQDAKPSTQVAEQSKQLEDLTAEFKKLQSKVLNDAAAQEIIETISQEKYDALFELAASTRAMEKRLQKAGKLPKNSHLVDHALVAIGPDSLATVDQQLHQVTVLAKFLRKSL